MALSPPLSAINSPVAGVAGFPVAGGGAILTAAQIRAFAEAVNLAGDTMTGDLKFTDATYDIGKSGATRPRDGFFSRNVAVGGTLDITGATTAAAITANNTLTLQNSTTAVLAEISKTYTSATSREYLGLGYDATAAAYFLGSKVGSAGGSNRPLKIGHLAADGTTFVGTTISTTGILTSSNQINIGTGIQLIVFNGTTYSTNVVNGTGICFFNNSGVAGYGVAIGSNTSLITSGARSELVVKNNFSPMSGTATNTALMLAGTVNQTGGANGITRGLYINPSIAAAYDWRAIEITTGKSIFQAIESTTITASGNLSLTTVGSYIQYKSGTGQRAGNATLVAGTVTVTNTSVTANTVITLTRKTAGGTIGNLSYTVSAGASFTINSDNALDTSVVSYHLLEVV